MSQKHVSKPKSMGKTGCFLLNYYQISTELLYIIFNDFVKILNNVYFFNNSIERKDVKQYISYYYYILLYIIIIYILILYTICFTSTSLTHHTLVYSLKMQNNIIIILKRYKSTT